MKLYRFEKLEDNRIETIQNGKLWFSSPDKFNDLDDSRLRGVVNLNLSDEEYQSIIKAFDLIQNIDKFKHPFDEQLLEELKNYINASAKTSDLFNSLNDSAFINKLSFFLRAHFGICCFFSDNIANPLMWAHYADNHKGFCIEYEYDANQDVSQKIHEVVYASQLPIFTARELLFAPEESATRILTTKNLIWHYEKEWRFVLAKTKGKSALPKNMKPSKIIQGIRCCEESSQKLKLLAKNLNIDLQSFREAEAI
jgi:hypothetical protein